LYTIVISTFIAAFFSITKPEISFPVYFCVSLSYGFIYSSIIMFLIWSIKPDRIINLIWLYLVGICLGVLIGYQAKILILQYVFSVVTTKTVQDFFVEIANGFVFGGGIGYFINSQAILRRRAKDIEEERIKRLTTEKESLAANLKLLQAQIEPHFLFNTLSNILSLIDTEPTKGKTMLVDLTKYLRTSLSRTLSETTILNQEIEMIKAYLNIHKIRMSDRLRFTIDISDALRQQQFPPMLLQPLVENAVKHGLEPKVEGGEIVIKAFEENSRLRIEVRDTGLGFSDYNKTGIGIINVRERIVMLYGEKGRLIIAENEPHGVSAIIEVPLHDL